MMDARKDRDDDSQSPFDEDAIRAALLRRSAASDQDWEMCKEWWRSLSVATRIDVIMFISKTHKDPRVDWMAKLAKLTLDRLLLEVWPGTPGASQQRADP